MSWNGANIWAWKRSMASLGLAGWLIATIAGGDPPKIARAEGAEAQAPAAKPTLRGTVLTTKGEPIANATVTIKSVLAGRGAVYVSNAKDCNRQELTKADGSFSFERLAAATEFRGVAAAPGYESQEFWSPNTLEIKLTSAPAEDNPRRTVRGSVMNAEGKPVEGARVLVHMLHTKTNWGSGGGVAFTDPQGRFVFRAKEDIIACDFRLEANGFVPRGFSEVRPGPDGTEYRLSAGASIAGRLLKDGKPVPDAGIGISGVKGGYLDSLSTVTDEAGRFAFSGVPAREEFHLFAIMRSLRELGALPRRRVKTGAEGARVELGDLSLEKGYTISGRVRSADGKPGRVAAFSLARTELIPKTGHAPAAGENGNRPIYAPDHSFDTWRADPGPDGKFEFTGVPGETVSIFLMLRPFYTLSPRNVSSDGQGFRLLGMVVSNKTDLIIELDPHSGQVFGQSGDCEALSRQPLQGAEAAIKFGRR